MKTDFATADIANPKRQVCRAGPSFNSSQEAQNYSSMKKQPYISHGLFHSASSDTFERDSCKSHFAHSPRFECRYIDFTHESHI